MIDEEQIRLFNEIMQNQSGEQAEGLASRYPSVFEVPRTDEIPDPLQMKGRIADSERRRKEQEEAAFQAQYGQKTLGQMARPEFIPDDVTAAIKAVGTLGSGAGAGIKAMTGEAVGMDPEAIMQRNIYLPEFLKKEQAALTPEQERELAFYSRYIDKGSAGLEAAGEALEPLGRAYDASKLDALMFMPGTRNISMIDDVIDVAIRGARDVAPVVKPAIQSAGRAARLAIRDDLLPLTQKATQATKEYFETPPVGAISLDTLGFSSRLSEGVDKLQDKGTGTQFLAQLSKMKGVPAAEIKVTGLDEYLKNTPKVTKQEVQDYLETNRLQLIEDERIAGAGRLTDRDLNTLPREFDWLDRYDLDEQFEDKAHLRNHLMVTLNRYFDELEVEAADTGGFHAEDSSGEVRYIPESKKFEWLEAEQDRIDDVLSEFPDFNSATKYPDEYQIPGGENYREILYKLPDDKVEGRFRSPPNHFDLADNTFGSIRATDRTIDGTPTLFAEEIQSDWAIKGAKGGYRTPEKMAEKNQLAEKLDASYKNYSKLTKAYEATRGSDLRGAKTIELEMQALGNEIIETQKQLNQFNQITVPDNPFRGNWYKPVINNFLVKAAKEGKGGIGFPMGNVVSDRYNLSNYVRDIEVMQEKDAFTLEPQDYKLVKLNIKDKPEAKLKVNKEGVVYDVLTGAYSDFKGKPLDEVVGKGVAEKIMTGGAQTISNLDLRIGGKGKDKLYDDMLPKHLNEIGKRYGVQLEKRTIPFSEGGKKESEVYFMPITEEMRQEILSEGLPMFKQGGSVKKFAPGGKVLKGISKGAREAAKEGQKMLQGVYRGYTGERLEEPVLSTTPQRKVAEYYATRRAATRGEDPHVEMLMVDPFVGKEYGLALPIDEFNRELLTTRARAIAPSDVVERTQLKKKGGLACLSK
jgi:hypothetical protein